MPSEDAVDSLGEFIACVSKFRQSWGLAKHKELWFRGRAGTMEKPFFVPSFIARRAIKLGTKNGFSIVPALPRNQSSLCLASPHDWRNLLTQAMNSPRLSTASSDGMYP